MLSWLTRKEDKGKSRAWSSSNRDGTDVEDNTPANGAPGDALPNGEAGRGTAAVLPTAAPRSTSTSTTQQAAGLSSSIPSSLHSNQSSRSRNNKESELRKSLVITPQRAAGRGLRHGRGPLIRDSDDEGDGDGEGRVESEGEGDDGDDASDLRDGVYDTESPTRKSSGVVEDRYLTDDKSIASSSGIPPSPLQQHRFGRSTSGRNSLLNPRSSRRSMTSNTSQTQPFIYRVLFPSHPVNQRRRCLPLLTRALCTFFLILLAIVFVLVAIVHTRIGHLIEEQIRVLEGGDGKAVEVKARNSIRFGGIEDFGFGFEEGEGARGMVWHDGVLLGERKDEVVVWMDVRAGIDVLDFLGWEGARRSPDDPQPAPIDESRLTFYKRIERRLVRWATRKVEVVRLRTGEIGIWDDSEYPEDDKGEGEDITVRGDGKGSPMMTILEQSEGEGIVLPIHFPGPSVTASASREKQHDGRAPDWLRTVRIRQKIRLDSPEALKSLIENHVLGSNSTSTSRRIGIKVGTLADGKGLLKIGLGSATEEWGKEDWFRRLVRLTSLGGKGVWVADGVEGRVEFDAPKVPKKLKDPSKLVHLTSYGFFPIDMSASPPSEVEGQASSQLVFESGRRGPSISSLPVTMGEGDEDPDEGERALGVRASAKLKNPIPVLLDDGRETNGTDADTDTDTVRRGIAVAMGFDGISDDVMRKIKRRIGKMDFEVPWNLGWSIYLANEHHPRGGEETEDVLMARVQTLPFTLKGGQSTASVKLEGKVTPSNSSKSLSDFLSAFLKGKSYPINIRYDRDPVELPGRTWDPTSSPPSFISKLLENRSIPLLFPGSQNPHQLIKNVSIEGMRFGTNDDGDLTCSGKVLGELWLPDEMADVKDLVDLKKVWPDVLVLDGDVPRDWSMPGGGDVSEGVSGSDWPPTVPPSNAFARLRTPDYVPSMTYPSPYNPNTTLISATLSDIPIEILQGREAVFRRYVAKVILHRGGSGVRTGILGRSDCKAGVGGFGDVELKDLRIKGGFWVGRGGGGDVGEIVGRVWDGVRGMIPGGNAREWVL